MSVWSAWKDPQAPVGNAHTGWDTCPALLPRSQGLLNTAQTYQCLCVRRRLASLSFYKVILSWSCQKPSMKNCIFFFSLCLDEEEHLQPITLTRQHKGAIRAIRKVILDTNWTNIVTIIS